MQKHISPLRIIKDPARILRSVSFRIRRLARWLHPRALWHLVGPGSRITIKHAGVANTQDRSAFYPSIYHFVHNLRASSRSGRFDYLVCQNFLHQEFFDFEGPKLYFCTEPITYLTEETMRNLEHPSVQKFLYRYDEPTIERRQFYFALPDNRKWTVEKLQRRKSEQRSKLCCIINRYSEQAGLILLEQRMKYVNAFGEDIDIYGREPSSCENRWEEFPNYYGAAENKLETQSQYTFALVFENTDLNGYITEKILDAMMAGTVPLYWGGGAFLQESVPSECFINCRDADPVDVLRRIKNMTLEEIVAFREAGIGFLSSDLADRFTRRYWAMAVAERLKGQTVNS